MAGKKKTTTKKAAGSGSSVRGSQGNPWDRFPELAHLQGDQLVRMQHRRRHRLVRYWCFRFKHDVDNGNDPGHAGEGPEKMPGFVEFWLEQKPVYQVNPRGQKVEVEPHRNRTVGELGGYATFAILWDVDDNLDVYLRHSSVWHEWRLTLMRVVPVLGE